MVMECILANLTWEKSKEVEVTFAEQKKISERKKEK